MPTHLLVRCKTAYGASVLAQDRFALLTRFFSQHHGQNVYLHCSVVVCGVDNMSRYAQNIKASIQHIYIACYSHTFMCACLIQRFTMYLFSCVLLSLSSSMCRNRKTSYLTVRSSVLAATVNCFFFYFRCTRNCAHSVGSSRDSVIGKRSDDADITRTVVTAGPFFVK